VPHRLADGLVGLEVADAGLCVPSVQCSAKHIRVANNVQPLSERPHGASGLWPLQLEPQDGQFGNFLDSEVC
jgi:hypothetical protein